MRAETDTAVGKPAQQSYIPELDGVRAISILLVLAAHMLPVGPSYLQLNAASGLMGMSLFFCLSGFLITRFLHDSPRIGDFLIRRIARIVPLLVLYAFIVAILIFGRWDTFAGVVSFVLNYSDNLFVAGVGHLWSICVEMHFYLLIALAVSVFGRRGFWLVPLAALVVLALRLEAHAYANIRTHLRIDEILSGSLLALFWINRARLPSWIGAVLARSFLPVLLLWMLSSHVIGGPLNYFRPYFSACLVGSLLCMPDGVARHLCRGRLLKYIAAISYALYIWHPLTILGWMDDGSRWTVYLFKRPLSFILTFVLAHASTHTIERYFMRLARSGQN